MTTTRYQVDLSKEFLEWTSNLVDKILNKFEIEPTMVSDIEMFMDAQTSLQNAEKIKTGEVEEPDTPKKISTKHNFCDRHPTYGAARPPRTDCEGCWAAYEKFHPMEYAIKRAIFERRSK